ncbi:TIGR03668 family PPOX class F420-dependent oxidoreductase [Phytoactinopolyspora alkaliphila]|uniref:TIGR03668 family PPOX class F420-dependent oxidoreductase n=1 Tax=Phytoactinopolyspora alkaliphila TaxID=1783498 RepID=A0A6N9YKQ5_9ACTN|nr:TIGR03668 family PPOX class F420-dependent oxidoreductase [Phytoactinopolyspora alkaliphila]NED95573.1 TIGR03668 family PPOX class F420-dependent oxidoreductase [Phytoactinopolyspora alkaliphila]
MRLSADECRVRLTAARVARLATAGADMRPHLVPVTFVVDGDGLVIGIDQKPKSTTRLRRLHNIMENPRVAVLGDHYDDDWTRLWWVRADGSATVVAEGSARDAAVEALTAKYPQYRDDPPLGPAIVVDIDRWAGWAYAS